MAALVRVLKRALAGLLLAGVTVSASADDAKYPDWSGAWNRRAGGTFDPDKPPGLAPSPLTTNTRRCWKRASLPRPQVARGTIRWRPACRPVCQG